MLILQLFTQAQEWYIVSTHGLTDVQSVVMHTHNGLSCRCKKNEIVICDMNRTEDHSAQTQKGMWSSSDGFLQSSSCGSWKHTGTYHRFPRGKNEKRPVGGHLGIRHQGKHFCSTQEALGLLSPHQQFFDVLWRAMEVSSCLLHQSPDFTLGRKCLKKVISFFSFLFYFRLKHFGEKYSMNFIHDRKCTSFHFPVAHMEIISALLLYGVLIRKGGQ